MNRVLKNVVVLGVLLAFGLSSGLAQAKSTEEGTFYVTPKVGMYGDTNKAISSMFTYGAEAGYFLVNGLGYVVYQKRVPVSGLNSSNNYEYKNAFSPIAIVRYNYMFSDKASVFAGVGVGGFWSEVKVPRNGYTSNFTEIGEVGFEVALTDMISLELAGRYQHIGEFTTNNGNYKGADNFGGNFGVKFSF